MTAETKRVTLRWRRAAGVPRAASRAGRRPRSTATTPRLRDRCSRCCWPPRPAPAPTWWSILEKMRVGLEGCRIEASGVRRETEPRRYTGDASGVPSPGRRAGRGQGAPRDRAVDHQVLLGDPLARARHPDHAWAHAGLAVGAACQWRCSLAVAGGAHRAAAQQVEGSGPRGHGDGLGSGTRSWRAVYGGDPDLTADAAVGRGGGGRERRPRQRGAASCWRTSSSVRRGAGARASTAPAGSRRWAGRWSRGTWC